VPEPSKLIIFLLLDSSLLTNLSAGNGSKFSVGLEVTHPSKKNKTTRGKINNA